MAGIGSLNKKEINVADVTKNKSDMKKPANIVPKKRSNHKITMPDDQVLVRYKGRLSKKFTPKTTQLQADTHMALKQVASIEDKPMRVVINEMAEFYINHMDDSQKALIIPIIRKIQETMPEENQE